MSLKPTFSPYWVILKSYLQSLHLMIILSNGALIFISWKCVNIRDIVGYKLGKKVWHIVDTHKRCALSSLLIQIA